MSTPVRISGPAVRGPKLGCWLLAAVTLAGVALAPAVMADPPQVSQAVFDHYTPASEAVKKGQYAAGLKEGKEALAAAKTSYEKEICLQVIFAAAANSKNYPEAIDAGEQLVAMPGLAAKSKLDIQKSLGQMYANTNKFDKAIAITKDYIRTTGGTAADWAMLANIYGAQQDCGNALPALDKALAGKSADEGQLNIQSRCYYKAHDNVKRIAVNEELLKKYPKQSYFNQLSVIYQTDSKLEDLALLELLRFGFDRDYLTQETEYQKLADLALDVGTSAEAQRVLEKGIAKKLLKSTDTKVARLLDQAKTRAVEDKKTLEQIDAEARAGKNGESDAKAADRYYSLQDYPKVVEAIQRGLLPDRVGKMKRPDNANMVLGIALLKLKKNADAAKAFTAAKADPRMAASARIWLNAT